MKKTILPLIYAVLASASLGWADDSKISPDLRNYNSTTPVQVVVQYVPGTQVNCNSLLNLLGCVVNDVLNLGGKVISSLPIVNGLVATLDGNGIIALSNQSNVVYISKDRAVNLLLDTAAPAVNAPLAWKSKYTGSGIAVALIDSGVNPHKDLNTFGLLSVSRVVYNKSFLSTSSATDQYGHGTHIAGIIAGNGASSTGSSYSLTFKGIAPNAKIINLRVLDGNGVGTDSSVITAIQAAVSLKATYNIRVINLSLGRGVFESYRLDPLCQAVEKAWKAGIVVVVAAGNNGRYMPTEGYGTITSPGNDPYVITVGAMKTMGTPGRSDDLIASYSSKGPTVIDRIVKPDIVAPGNLMASSETTGVTLEALEPDNLIPYSYYVFGGSSAPSASYFRLSGTSMAAGVVSGVVADLLQARPTLTPDQVKARLMKSASKTFPGSSSVYDPTTGNTYVSYYDVFTVGAGYVDLAAALASTDLAYGTAMSPPAAYDANSGTVYLSRDLSSTWGTSVTWTPVAVYGPASFTSGGTSVMWGATGPGGSSVMWGATNSGGASVMWGATNDTASSVMWGASGPPTGEK